MSEKICPVCGKSNPEEAELCQFCGSGFVENISGTSDEHAPEKPSPSVMTDLLAGLAHLNDEEDDVPAWLKDLQGNMPAPAEEQPAAEAPTGDVEPQGQPGTSESESGLAGELGGFQFNEGSEPSPQAADETPDWLNALKAYEEDNQPVQPGGATPSTAGENKPNAEEAPDWLAALTGVPGAQNEPDLQAQPVDNETPDWISSFRGTTLPGEPSQDAGAVTPEKVELPDWLSALGTDEPKPAESTPTEDRTSSNLPSWLADLQNPASPGEEESPAETNAPNAEETPAALPASELPSWLADMQNPLSPGVEESPGGVVTPATEETPAALPASKLPSWLADLQNPVSPAQEETPGEPLASEAPAPPETAPAPVESTSSLPADSGLPAWMVEALNARAAEQPEAGTPAAENESMGRGGELPAWMAGLGETILPTEAPGDKPTETPAKMETASSGGEIPGAEKAGEVPGVSSADEEYIGAESSAGIEKSLAQASTIKPNPEPPLEAEIEPSMSAPEEQQNIDSILAMDTPEWLSDFSSGEPPQSSAPAAEPQVPTDELPAGELPSWLHVLRPMESDAEKPGTSTEEQDIEEQGPLAGLSSVLPTQPGSSAGNYKPNTLSARLLISVTQQTQAALLENLLNSESNSQTFSQQRLTLLNKPVRWIIAAVMLAAVLISAALGSNIFPSPGIPAESSQAGMFIKTLSGLPDGAAMLVVMDYQPGFAGELEATAGPVLGQLMGKDARLAFLSTSPLGGLMAERLVQKYAVIYAYQAGSQYVNLGYLPGGAGGIKAFAEQPRLVLGQDSVLGNLWDSPALQAVTIDSQTSLNNFAAVIVMTDNPDTGRLWIEQTQPSLGSTPLLMVVSAQAGPMLQPYFDSNQIKGLLSGLEGALLYENAQGKPGQARAYWDGFGVAVLAAELMILIGGVWSVISSLHARRTAVEQDEA